MTTKHTWTVFVTVLAVLLGGCGGSGGGSGLDLESVTPGDGATNQEVDPALLLLRAIFAEALDPATVDADALRLEGPSGAVDGTVSLSGDRTIVFEPDAPLALAASFTATLAADIASTSGDELGSEPSWSFATRDGQWQGAMLAETDETAGAANVRMAMGHGGHAVVSWSAFPGGVTDVFVNYFDPQSGWQGFQAPRQGIASATFPAMQLAVDDDGNALGVWGERTSPPGGPSSFFATTFGATSGAWSLPQELDSDATATADALDIATGPGGSFWTVFGLNQGATMEVHVNKYTPGSGWSGEMELENTAWDPGDSFLSPVRIAVDANGNAVAAWSRHTDTDGSMTIDNQDDESAFARYYDAASGNWTATQQLNTGGENDALVSDVLVVPGGFLVVWNQWDASFAAAGYGTFHRAGAWEASEMIWDHGDDLFLSRVAVDANGNVIVTGSGNDTLFAAEYRAGSGWQTPVPIEDAPGLQVAAGALAMNAAGEAITIWREGATGFDDLYARRFDPVSRTWSAAEKIETPDTGIVANAPQVAIDDAGNAVAAWHANDSGDVSAYTARYRAGNGWGGAEPLETGGDNTVSAAIGLGIDASGRAVTTWAQGMTDDQDVYFNRFE
jgi:hypothetical protein